MQNGRLDLGDHFQVVVRPGQAERLGEVRLAEEPKVGCGPRLALWIDHLWDVADVPPDGR